MLRVWATALFLAVGAPFAPNDPGYETNRPLLEAMSVPEAWTLTQGDSSVVIAVIDSGVVADPDLRPNLTSGHNVLDGGADTTDQNGHGTAMAAIAAPRSTTASASPASVAGAGSCRSRSPAPTIAT